MRPFLKRGSVLIDGPSRGESRPFHVLVLGDIDSPEMVDVRWTLASLDCQIVREFKTGSPADNERQFPDLIVVCQHWPDEFSSQEVFALLSANPLARLVCCHGPWCDSDGRNRDVWPPGCRVPADQAAFRIRAEMDVLRGLPGARVLPLTASRTEVFEAQYPAADAGALAVSLAVVSPDSAYRVMLEAAVRGRGARVVSSAEADVIVFDIDPGTTWQEAALQELCRQPSCRVIVLAGLPSASLVERMRTLGAEQVVAKLAPWGQLFQAVRGVESSTVD